MASSDPLAELAHDLAAAVSDPEVLALTRQWVQRCCPDVTADASLEACFLAVLTTPAADEGTAPPAPNPPLAQEAP